MPHYRISIALNDLFATNLQLKRSTERICIKPVWLRHFLFFAAPISCFSKNLCLFNSTGL